MTEKSPQSLVYSIDADLMSGLKKLPRVARMAKYREMVSDFHKENKLGEGRLLLPDRRRHIVVLRWELIYRLKEQLGFTNKELSRLFKMDHTTILHGYRRHKELNGIE